MKSSIISAVLATMTTVASASDVFVNSHCPFTVYLQSFPYDGSAPGNFTILKGGNTVYSEAFKSTGSTIKLSNERDLSNPLFLGYTNQQSMVYYDLNTDHGNPFAAYRNKLIPSNAACGRFNCGPNKDQCYDHNNSKVPGCAKPVTLTATLCA